MKIKYENEDVKTLDSISHIRQRSGMYVSRIGDGSHIDDGIYILLKEVIDNAIDEFIMGNGTEVIVDIKDKKAAVRDYGRGIPLGKVVDCASIINTGAKFDSEAFQFSVGMNGVGIKAVNALSSKFVIASFREGKTVRAEFERGVLISKDEQKTKEPDGTYVEFVPDEEIFKDYEFKDNFIDQRIRDYTYLNSGLTIVHNRIRFSSVNGLLDLTKELAPTPIYDPIYVKTSNIEFAISHSNEYGDSYRSYVNGQYTSEGGTHLTAFKEGITRGVNAILKKQYKSDDVREGMFATIAIRMKDPMFESQTKNKLGSTDVKSWILPEVVSSIEDFLRRNPETLKKLEAKVIHNEHVRTLVNDVRKDAREASKRVSVRVDKLKDCKYHRGDKKHTQIFLVEGDSASGSITPARDVMTQAVFALRGKPENMYLKSRSEIYKNKELHNLVTALGIENSIDDLRYDDVIIATDADFDGFHIRNLVLTFFLQYYPGLVKDKRIKILETPLFRVRDKKSTVYCYSETERDATAKKMSNPEVTRFKGLGEISPKEFGQFIGSSMKSIPVVADNPNDIPRVLAFYSGANTPKRRDVIIEHLKEVLV